VLLRLSTVKGVAIDLAKIPFGRMVEKEEVVV